MSNTTSPPNSPPNSPPPNGPAAGGPEYLSYGGGEPVPPARRDRAGRKPLVIGAAVVASIGLVGGAAFAVSSFLAPGEQPAQALPAGTLGYLSIDLDPSGGQKIEAVRTLNKFPGFSDMVDLRTDDDLRKALFDKIQESDGCPGLDYGDDIEPWLGNRVALAAVDLGQDTPAPVVVVQVSDADAAEKGLAKVADCSAGGRGGFAVAGDWAVIAQDDGQAEKVVTATEDGNLADDSDYQTWTSRAGDPGIVSMYAAPGAGQAIADAMAGAVSGEDLLAQSQLGSSDALKDFEGAAATIRFTGGAIELATAGSLGPQIDTLYATEAGDDAMSTLPEDTLAAVGVGFQEGWLGDVVDQFATLTGQDTSSADIFAVLSAQTGLDLPTDAETLLGESAVLAVGGDLDPEKAMNSGDFSDLPVGLKVRGDADKINAVVAKLQAQLPPESADLLQVDDQGGMVAYGPSADYRAALLEDGSLGDSATFKEVVPEADRSGAIFYLDFDGGDNWLVKLAADEDEEVVANLEPLSALGMSTWRDGDVDHGLIRLTTD